MLARIRKSLNHDESGFTLIELLVVMIIIGILAAIAIPVFMSQQDKAKDTALKSDVSTVAKEIATYYVDGSAGLTLTATGEVATLSETGGASVATINLSAAQTVAASSITNSSTWCVALTQPDTGSTYEYDSATGMGQGNCA